MAKHKSQVVIKKEEESNDFLIISLVILGILVIALLVFTLYKFTPAVSVDIGSSPVLGNESAKVTIYEFSDFSCPYCAAAEGQNAELEDYLRSMYSGWEPTMPLIKENYIDTGKAKLVFKYAPGHGTGEAAHLVGWCLNDQGLFWQFKDLAFANQLNVGSLDKMKSLASTLTGVDMDKLNSCLSSNKYNSFFDKDSAMASSAGVRGTPYLLIDGKLIVATQPFSNIQKLIEASLSKS